MKNKCKVFFVKEFPIDRITSDGAEGWYTMPTHTRTRFRFFDAILEHIDNTFCEPIQIVLRNENEISAGSSGVTRLYALRHKRGWSHIPAIVSAYNEPDWLDTTVPVETLSQYRSFYRLEPKDYGFEEDGQAYHRNENPNPAQVLETFVVSDATKKRILDMLAAEALK